MININLLLMLFSIFLNCQSQSCDICKCSTKCMPVCGRLGEPSPNNNYRDFLNECQMNAVNCLIKPGYSSVNLQECISRNIIPCNGSVCDKKYCTNCCQPVCGLRLNSNPPIYKAFQNDCLFKANNCVDKPGFKKVSVGCCINNGVTMCSA